MPLDSKESPREQSAQPQDSQAMSDRCCTYWCSPRTSGPCTQFLAIEFARRTVAWRQLRRAVAVACSVRFPAPVPFIVPEATRVEPTRRIWDKIGITPLHTLRVEPDT